MSKKQHLDAVIQFSLFFILALFALILLSSNTPNHQPVPGTDSSVFLYEGQQIINGSVPYRDVWDHKGPLVYYINALGLALSGGSRWGVWLIEFIAIFTASWFCFDSLLKEFGLWPAIFGSLTFFVMLSSVLDGGNLVEEYALPFQFLLIWLFSRATHQKDYWIWIIIGVASAACFLLRPNIIGIPVSIGAVTFGNIVWGQANEKRKRILVAIASGAFTLFIVGAFFGLQTALSDFWDQVFVFNFAYNDTNIEGAKNSIIFGLGILGPGAFLAVGSWGIGLKALIADRERFDQKDFVALLLLDLMLEFALASVSGRTYPHYYMSWLPVLALLEALFIFYITQAISGLQASLNKHHIAIAISAPLIFAFFLSPIVNQLPLFEDNLDKFWKSKGIPSGSLVGNPIEPTLFYINKNTSSDDRILVWGNRLAINFHSNRKSPTKYIYQIALFQPGYTNESIVNSFLADLQQQPPALIIDASGPPYLPLSIEKELVPTRLISVYNFIFANYVPVERLPQTRWQVYELVNH